MAPRSLQVAEWFVVVMAAFTGGMAVFEGDWMLAAWCLIAAMFVFTARMRDRAIGHWKATAETLRGVRRP